MSGSCIGSSTGYVMLPLVKNVISYYWQEKAFPYEMPFKAAFVYEIESPFAYIISYLIQVSCAWYGPILNVSFTNFAEIFFKPIYST